MVVFFFIKFVVLLYIFTNLKKLRAYEIFIVIFGVILGFFDQNSNLFTILAISYFIYLLYLAKKIMDTKENISIKIPLFIVMFIILINILYYIL